MVRVFVLIVVCLSSLGLRPQKSQGQVPVLQIFPEQRSIQVRAPESFCPVPLSDVSTPFTVASPKETRQEQPISLDEAIHIALVNADVIRVLTGISATSSGRTIYDVPVINTSVDEASAEFDPRFRLDLTYEKPDRPVGFVDTMFVGAPGREILNSSISLAKKTLNGADASLDILSFNSYFDADPNLDSQLESTVQVTLRQPLMRGYGKDVNQAPIVIARIDTERSYFQFKDSVQELVRGVIAAYWNVVSARVDVWARQQQIKQAQFAFERATARRDEGLARAADVAQARSALANFKAALITARANLILFETALRNIMGLEPSDTTVLMPTSAPLLERIELDWNQIVGMAERYRPDIIELKLILEADGQQVMRAKNFARPQLDGVASYRWDGISGELQNGLILPYEPGRFAGFNVGVNFSVPLGLRQSRAALRRQELVIARDRVNLDQGIYQMVQQLTINYRNLDQFFEQYVAFQEVRKAARLNYENQAGEFATGAREFLNVLQAITDWGNAVSQEARSITQYNTELANLERETGTILETHGVRFLEERFCSLGPHGLFGIRRTCESYPSDLRPEGVADRYSESKNNSDDSFNLEDLDVRRSRDRNTPKPQESPPSPDIEAPRPSFGDDSQTSSSDEINR